MGSAGGSLGFSGEFLYVRALGDTLGRPGCAG